jgi:hypothetical protein
MSDLVRAKFQRCSDDQRPTRFLPLRDKSMLAGST